MTTDRMLRRITEIDFEMATMPLRPVSSPCAYCGERSASHVDADGRPECSHCEALPVPEPIEMLEADLAALASAVLN